MSVREGDISGLHVEWLKCEASRRAGWIMRANQDRVPAGRDENSPTKRIHQRLVRNNLNKVESETDIQSKPESMLCGIVHKCSGMVINC